MNLQSKLEQFRSDNPYDVNTQAKRLLASEDKELILYTLALGLQTAKQRQRHAERDYIKNIGATPPKEQFVSARPIVPPNQTGGIVSGRASGTVTPIVKHSTRLKNAMRQLIGDVWRINGEQKLNDANANDLAAAIKRENASSDGHGKNANFYGVLKQKLDDKGIDKVGEKWDEKSMRKAIEGVYGEFRKSEAA